jgi:hypothetical protein
MCYSEFVDSTLVVFLRVVLWFLFRELLYCVCASKCDVNVCVLEEVGQFSYPWAVVCKDSPFFWFCFCSFHCPVLGVFSVFFILAVL